MILRLWGSHPAYPGPKVLELFYLARVHGWLRRTAGGESLRSPIQWVLGDPATAGTGLPLLNESALVIDQGHDVVGREGRRQVLDPFDAFADFFRYNGEVPDARIVSTLRSNATICLDAWSAGGPAQVGRLQNAVRELWWALSGPSQAKQRQDMYRQMRRLLDDDARMLANSGDTVMQTSWTRACQAVFASGEALLAR